MAGAAQPLARRGDYGWDAPYVPLSMGAAGLLLIAVALGLAGRRALIRALAATYDATVLASTASYVYATQAGKFAVWRDLLNGLDLRGDETVLDVGCGRGAVLLMAAKLLPRGRAVGVDLWKTSDQSSNSPDVTRRNAELEGVSDRVELRTADMRELPFEDGTFDLVVSSLAIHNVEGAAGRRAAVGKAARVLKPVGRLLIADFRSVGEYRDRLRQLGLRDVAVRTLDWRFWYGGPWATKLVTAAKPAPP